MICLNNDFCLEEFNQIYNFLFNSNKTCNFKPCWLIVFFNNDEEFKKKNRLNRAAIRSISIRKDLVNNIIKYYYLKVKFFRNV